jgi:proline iminopeptidase
MFRMTVLLAISLGLAAGAQARAKKPQGVAVEKGYIKTADGARLFYEKTGSGPAIIVPGRLFLFPAFKQLADQYTIVSYDMRDRGRSSFVADDAKLTIQNDIADLEAVRRHFGINKFVPVGYSYLGLMVIMYAMDHPEHVERIVQLGPVPLKWPGQYPPQYMPQDLTPVPDRAAVEELEQLKKQHYDRAHPKDYCEKQWAVQRFRLIGDPANVNKISYQPCLMPNEYPVALDRHFRFAFTSVQKLDIPKESLARVQVPVLIIHGTQDRNAPYGSGREWAHNLPDARLLTVPNGAHQSFDEYPEIVFPAISAFLAGEWPADARKIDTL